MSSAEPKPPTSSSPSSLGGVEVRQTAGRGRALFATRRFAAGARIAVEQAAVAVPTGGGAGNTSALASLRCARCLTSGAPSRCGRCRVARYCGAKCQRADWRQHGPGECALLAGVSPRTAPAPARAVVRLLALRRADDPSAFKAVTGLVAHREQFVGQRSADLEAFAQMAMLVRTHCGQDLLAGVEPKELLELFCRFAVNSMAVIDAAEGVDVGVCVLPTFAMMNHSCSPNCAIVFDGTSAILRALVDIEEGEQARAMLSHSGAASMLTQSYIEIADDVDKRRRELSSRYFFDCDCALCIAQSERRSMGRCVACNSGFVSGQAPDGPWRCSHCGDATSEAAAAAHQRVESLVRSTESPDVSDGDLHKAVANLSAALEAPTGALLAAQRRVLDRHLSAGAWTTALEVSDAAVASMRKLYPTLHPALSVQLYVSAKLAAVLAPDPPDASVEARFANAALALARSHGRDHPLAQEAATKCEEIRRSRALYSAQS
ncbi:hypothetical protein HK405_012837 [Cladochytrium tenue]|nr:hypothetical protein HK405_012837 [Cladochytrium tenue]